MNSEVRDESPATQTITEGIKKEAGIEPCLDINAPGYCRFERRGSSMAFVRALFIMTLSSDVYQKLGLVCREKEKDTFKEGIVAALKFDSEVREIANHFCGRLVEKLEEAGFRVREQARGRQVLKDGRSVGPGIAVFLRGGGDYPDESSKPNDVHRQVEHFANDLKYSLADGTQIPVKVERVVCGIESGGGMFEAVVEDPDGSSNRVVAESLGLGREFGFLSAREFNLIQSKVGVMWNKYLRPRLAPEQQEFRRECEGLMKDLIRAMIATRRLDDSDIWQVIQEEIEVACPTFHRIREEARREIFRRVKVRLGLENDV